MLNFYYVTGNEVIIRLPRKKYPNNPLWTIIDLVDLERMERFSHFWRALYSSANNTYYAGHSTITAKAGKNRYIFLHNLLMEIKAEDKTKEVDHKNINSLDNRRHNLRVVTRQINSFNKNLNSNNVSGTTGVSRHKPTGKWRAHIMLDYKQKHLGLFKTIEEAIEARSKAEDAFKL